MVVLIRRYLKVIQAVGDYFKNIYRQIKLFYKRYEYSFE